MADAWHQSECVWNAKKMIAHLKPAQTSGFALTSLVVIMTLVAALAGLAIPRLAGRIPGSAAACTSARRSMDAAREQWAGPSECLDADVPQVADAGTREAKLQTDNCNLQTSFKVQTSVPMGGDF
jgi:hypothetical protein